MQYLQCVIAGIKCAYFNPYESHAEAYGVKEKLIFIGTGAGLVLFAIYGLLPGSFLGGVMGLNLTGLLFGYPVTGTILSRTIVAMSMLLGVMITGLAYLIAGSVLGWCIGSVIDAVKKHKKIDTSDGQSQQS